MGRTYEQLRLEERIDLQEQVDKRMHPEGPELHFSHETIYQAIYAMPRGDLRAEVIALLRLGHAKRRPRTRGQDRRGQIPQMVSIHERPAEVAERPVPSPLGGRHHQGPLQPHKELTQKTGVPVYFADPHSPWQRGINENTNGLLRQYLPKGQDLSLHSQDDLDAIAWALNTRPRKSLGWKCPAEVFLPDFDFVKYRHHHFKPLALQT